MAISTTTVEELKQAIRNWVASVTGRPAYFQNEMGPIPLPRPYATVFLRDFDPRGHQRRSFSEDGLTETVTGHASCTFAISLWQGNNPVARANTLRSSLWASARFADLWAVCGKGAVGDIRDLSGTFGKKFERRAEFDLTVHAALAENFTSDFFDHNQVEVKETDRGLVAQFRGGDPVTNTEGC